MLWIEKADNAFQLITLGICMAVSLYRAFFGRRQGWIVLSMFFSVITMGNLYWFLYIMFYDQTPYYDFIPDFCWASAYLFLVLLLMNYRKNETQMKRVPAFWLIPVFTGGMALFFMRWGEYLTNIIYAVFMSLLLYYSISGLRSEEKKTPLYRLYFLTLVYCIIEYCLWLSSCFSWQWAPIDPYFIFDVLLTLVYIAFIPVMRKVEEQ